MSVISLLLDGAMVTMLAATIYYAVTLKRRLAVLHTESAEMQTRLAEFTRAADRAEHSLAALKSLPPSNDAPRQPVMSPAQLDQASAVRDELVFLIQAGDKVASHLKSLEKSVSRSVFSAVPPTSANASTLRKAAGGARPGPRAPIPKANGKPVLGEAGFDGDRQEPVLRATA